MGTPQLNIKDAEATRLVRELTELTGETRTEAIRRALRERLEREKAERRSHATRTAPEKRRQVEQALAEIKKVQDEVRRLGLAEHMLTDDDLYDENGLPKSAPIPWLSTRQSVWRSSKAKSKPLA